MVRSVKARNTPKDNGLCKAIVVKCLFSVLRVQQCVYNIFGADALRGHTRSHTEHDG